MATTTYTFTTTVNGLNLDNENQLAKLENTPEDLFVLPVEQNRVHLLSCEITAESICEAVRKLHKFLADATPEITLERVIPELVNMTQIAMDLEINRETVRGWDKTGHNHFPAPYTTIQNGSRTQPVWIWGDICAWASEHTHSDALDDDLTPLTTDQIFDANTELRDCQRKRGLTRVAWANHATQESRANTASYTTRSHTYA